MSANEKFQLVVYDGDFSLPSFDPECIKSILYTVVAKIPVQVKLLNNVKQCTFYTAPSFIHKNLQFKSFNETLWYLRTLNYNLDSKLSAKQCSETLALGNFVLWKLKPVVEFVYWVDQRNCDEFTTVWFMRALPFPFNYMHTRKFKEKALALIEIMYPNESNLDVIREFLSKSAVEVLSSLSTRLGTADYFHGSSPTSLDVIIYSYLAPLVKIPFPSNEISNLISMWPNLTNFVKRIDTVYLPDIPKQSKYLKEIQKVKTSDDDVSYIAILILTVSATSLVLGFAFTKGIIFTKSLS